MTRPKCSWVLLLALAAANSLTAAEITPSPALTSSPSGTTMTDPSIVGDWTSTAPNGMVISFSFKEDGTLLWVIEKEKTAQSTHAKYRLDLSVQPKVIEMFDFEEGNNKGQRLRGIFELQSDGRIKLDFVKDPEAPALKDFSDEALVFSKATSPVVRPDKPAAPASTP